uniref:Uncharacterized protein n=1 Tax=Anguilla anguilla TaxID=7936 RepID=A0A0E9PNI0_ANGAN
MEKNTPLSTWADQLMQPRCVCSPNAAVILNSSLCLRRT